MSTVDCSSRSSAGTQPAFAVALDARGPTEEVDVSVIFEKPPKEDGISTGVRAPKSLLARLDEMSEATGYSRNQLWLMGAELLLTQWKEHLEKKSAGEAVDRSGDKKSERKSERKK